MFPVGQAARQTKVVSPRCSIIAAIDTCGNLYASVSQVNTNKDTFQMFLSHLAAKLDSESPEWRANTFIVVDGAPYHKCPATIALVKSLGMSCLIAGPYAFEAMPVETLFSFVKRVDLNAGSIPTGKKSKSITHLVTFQVCKM